MSDEPNVYYDGERWVYRASSLGGCEEGLLAARMGMTAEPPPERFQKIFAQGHELEDRVIAIWEKATGDRVVNRQNAVAVGLHGPGPYISGHIDGVAEYEGMKRVVEVKCLGEELYEGFKDGAFYEGKGLWEKYRWQLSCYMHGLQMPAVMIAGLKDTDDEGKTRILEINWKTVLEPPVSMHSLLRRVQKIEQRAEKGDAPECKGIEYPCPYWYIHTEPEVPREEDEKLERLCEEYAEAKRASKVAEDHKKYLAGLVEERLRENQWADGEQRAIGKWLVEWKEVPVKEHTVKATVRKFVDVKKGKLWVD